jgi:putative redox protein
MKVRRAELRHEGGLRFTATTGTGRHLVFGDLPEDGEHSPMELVAAALAGCSAMDVVSILRKKRQAFDSYTVSVRAIQRDAYPRVLTTVDLLHEVVGAAVTEEAVRRSIELSATKYCPVSAMLSAGPTRIRHGYRVRTTGPDGFEVEGVAAETGPNLPADVIAGPEATSGESDEPETGPGE